MIQRFLLLSAFALFFSLIEGTPRSLAATNDPASIVSDLGSRAIAAMPNGDTAAANQKRFRELFRQYFDVEACARFALGTALSRQLYRTRIESQGSPRVMPLRRHLATVR